MNYQKNTSVWEVPNMERRQEVAMQIVQTNKNLSTAERLAALRSDGKTPHYRNLPHEWRVRWIGDQIFALNLLNHRKEVDGAEAFIDAVAFDGAVMDDACMADLTLAEMQEAFRNGINGAYGDYFGITMKSLTGFLRGFLADEKKQAANFLLLAKSAEAEEEDRKEKEARFWKEMMRAEKEGRIVLPKFGTGKKERSTLTEAERKAHREKIAGQVEEIYRRYGKRCEPDI